ncbi:MAG: YdcF family protein [Gammaproteobacteria bacterium]|nr:YdcF family protein [Gammaproteobacteria bacterium]
MRRKGFDGDARFTLFLSLLVGTLTLGLSHVFVFLRVRKRAMTSQHTSNNVTAIAVPGHQLKKGEISTDYRLRLDRVVNLYRESDDAVIRIIGGRPSLGISEAQAGNQYLIEQDIPATAISMEEISTNTLENMKNSRCWFSLFDEVVLVSNRYHLERLQTLARGLDFVTRPCAAEESIDLSLGKLLTETLFLHWYWAGRIYATVTHNHRMLDKIR